MMKTLTQIKAVINELPARKRRALANWLNEKEETAWDAQLDQDAATGKLQFLIDEAEKEEKAGKLRKFP